MKKAVLILLALSVCSGCSINEKTSDAENVMTLSVAPYQVMGMGAGPRRCYIVKEQADADWRLFYAPINGFEFEPGTSYTLKVKKSPVDNPPADASSLRYDLVEVVEKKTEIQPLQNLHGNWRVTRLNGNQAIPPNVGQTLEFDVTTMTVTGYGGSNRYRAQLRRIDGPSQVGIERVVSTKRFGPHQQQEDVFLDALQKVDGYYRYGSSLLLLAEKRVVIEAELIE